LVGVLHCGTLDDMSPGQSRNDGENGGCYNECVCSRCNERVDR
jgi:hypothetical protein